MGLWYHVIVNFPKGTDTSFWSGSPPDPIGLAGGINSFAYVGNNPVLYRDPSGLCPQDPTPTPVSQGIDQARQALQQNTLCRALFGGTNPLTLLNTYASNGLISSGTTYPVAQSGGGIRQQNFSSGDIGAVTSYAAGSYPSPTSPGVRISANPITINQNGFYFSGNNSAGVAVNTLQGAGFQGLSLGRFVEQSYFTSCCTLSVASQPTLGTPHRAERIQSLCAIFASRTRR